jgi:integrase
MRRKGYIKENPFRDIRCPSPTYEDRKFLRKEDVEKIITAVHNHSGPNLLILKRNLVIFYTLLFCGLRREELLLLQIRDIDLQRKVLTVRAETSKIPRTRRIPIHSQLVIYLKDYLNQRRHLTTQYLIVSSTRDNMLSYDGLNHLVKKFVAVSGVKFTLHRFRHTFAAYHCRSDCQTKNPDCTRTSRSFRHRLKLSFR